MHQLILPQWQAASRSIILYITSLFDDRKIKKSQFELGDFSPISHFEVIYYAPTLMLIGIFHATRFQKFQNARILRWSPIRT